MPANNVNYVSKAINTILRSQPFILWRLTEICLVTWLFNIIQIIDTTFSFIYSRTPYLPEDRTCAIPLWRKCRHICLSYKISTIRVHIMTIRKTGHPGLFARGFPWSNINSAFHDFGECVNSLALGRCGWSLNSVIWKLVSRIDILGVSC